MHDQKKMQMACRKQCCFAGFFFNFQSHQDAANDGCFLPPSSSRVGAHQRIFNSISKPVLSFYAKTSKVMPTLAKASREQERCPSLVQVVGLSVCRLSLAKTRRRVHIASLTWCKNRRAKYVREDLLCTAISDINQ